MKKKALIITGIIILIANIIYSINNNGEFNLWIAISSGIALVLADALISYFKKKKENN